MAKMSKEEIKAKYSDKIEDIDLATELLEDIEDSMDVEIDTPNEELIALKTESEHLKQDLEDLKIKYKNRFLGITEDKKDEEDKIDYEKEDEIIDIKEI